MLSQYTAWGCKVHGGVRRCAGVQGTRRCCGAVRRASRWSLVQRRPLCAPRLSLVRRRPPRWSRVRRRPSCFTPVPNALDVCPSCGTVPHALHALRALHAGPSCAPRLSLTLRRHVCHPLELRRPLAFQGLVSSRPHGSRLVHVALVSSCPHLASMGHFFFSSLLIVATHPLSPRARLLCSPRPRLPSSPRLRYSDRACLLSSPHLVFTPTLNRHSSLINHNF